MMNKCCKFQSYICNGLDKKWIGTKFNQHSKSKKGHNSYKKLDRVMSSCLLMEVMMMNKCCKFQSCICNGLDKKWIGTKNLTNILSRKRAIILTKTLKELFPHVCWWRYWWWISDVSFKAILVMVWTKSEFVQKSLPSF